ncbi:MAG: hypothetical protein WEB57_10015 [Pseudohongiellaceae bacterium]
MICLLIAAPGAVADDGTLSGNATITENSVFNGGTINGSVDNRGEIAGEVTLGRNASVTGGRISGQVTGDPDSPARIDDALILSGAGLENVVVGPDTALGPDVALGANVRFESEGSLHPGLDLTASLDSVPWVGGDARPVPRLSDSVLVDGGRDMLDAIRELEDFGPAGAVLEQDETSGELRVHGEGFSATVLPISVRKADPHDATGTYVDRDGNVRFVTQTGREVVAMPVLANRDVLTGFLDGLGLSLTVYVDRGTMIMDTVTRITPQSATSDEEQSAGQAPDDSGYNVGRADLLVVPATRGEAPGVIEYTVPGMRGLVAYSVLFEDEGGTLMQQDIVPSPINWSALQQGIAELPGVTDMRINEQGIITVELDGETVRGRMGYRVERGRDGPGTTTLRELGDLTGNGRIDFEVEYPGGRRQRLYVYP